MSKQEKAKPIKAIKETQTVADEIKIDDVSESVESTESKQNVRDLFARKEKWGAVVMTEQASMAGDVDKKDLQKRTNILNGRMVNCIHKPRG